MNHKNIRKYILLSSLFAIAVFSYAMFTRTKENTTVDVLIPKKEIASSNSVALDNVKIKVSSKEYIVSIKNGDTVYDAMKKLSNDKNSGFTFHFKDYSDLGIFVDSINGVEGTPGKYWLYYVNNKKASIGISNNKLKAGDVIDWKQESF